MLVGDVVNIASELDTRLKVLVAGLYIPVVSPVNAIDGLPSDPLGINIGILASIVVLITKS
jgi:hypothetical protein